MRYRVMGSINHYSNIKPYITRDGSEIRELMHPNNDHNQLQSLAEAIVKPAQKTLLHYHNESEELYYIIQGSGRMTLNEDAFQVKSGDTICIIPGTKHNIENTGNEDLKIICSCSPAYSHTDTVLI